MAVQNDYYSSCCRFNLWTQFPLNNYFLLTMFQWWISFLCDQNVQSSREIISRLLFFTSYKLFPLSRRSLCLSVFRFDFWLTEKSSLVSLVVIVFHEAWFVLFLLHYFLHRCNFVCFYFSLLFSGFFLLLLGALERQTNAFSLFSFVQRIRSPFLNCFVDAFV